MKFIFINNVKTLSLIESRIEKTKKNYNIFFFLRRYIFIIIFYRNYFFFNTFCYCFILIFLLYNIIIFF